ncbi:MAG: YdbL family protein [Deltaproteobacteria bacterium]|nr:YdbL family protein [Deltaproteobacteria bacterium]
MTTPHRPLRLLSLVALAGSLALAACAEPGYGDELPYPSELADERSPWEAEKREIIDRLEERRPIIRDMLAAEIAGEDADGYLAEPPSDAIITAADVQIMEQDNADRAALYEVITRNSILESLQEQTDDIVFQVTAQVCPQLQDQGLPCDEEAMAERVYRALDAAIVGEPFPAEDSIDAVIRQIAEPIVHATVQVATATVLPYVQEAFAREYQKRAPSGTWCYVDDAWRQRK